MKQKLTTSRTPSRGARHLEAFTWGLALTFAAFGMAAAARPDGPGNQLPVESPVVVGSVIIDGDLDDMIEFAKNLRGCTIIGSDPLRDICWTSPTGQPCNGFDPDPCLNGGPSSYFKNGCDYDTVVVAYDRPNRTLYCGYQTSGQIGDADGDGTDDDCGLGGPDDGPGITGADTYRWIIDINCELPGDAIAVRVEDDVVKINGVPQPTSRAIFQYMHGDSAASIGRDLEVEIREIDLPPVYRLNTWINFADGMSEDFDPFPPCDTLGVSLDMACTGPAQPICEGDSANFTITVGNPEFFDVTDAELNVPLPIGLDFVDFLVTDGWDSCRVLGRTITCWEDLLPADAIRTMTFRARNSSCQNSPITFLAMAEASLFQEGCIDTTGFAQTTCQFECADGPEVACEITASPDSSACAGDTVTITVVGTNLGPDPGTITIVCADTSTSQAAKPGQSISLTATVVTPDPCDGSFDICCQVSVENTCGTADTTCCLTIMCDSASVVLESCIGEPVKVAENETYENRGRARNAGPETGTITVSRCEGDTVETCPDVPPGGVCDFVDSRTPPVDGCPGTFMDCYEAVIAGCGSASDTCSISHTCNVDSCEVTCSAIPVDCDDDGDDDNDGDTDGGGDDFADDNGDDGDDNDDDDCDTDGGDLVILPTDSDEDSETTGQLRVNYSCVGDCTCTAILHAGCDMVAIADGDIVEVHCFDDEDEDSDGDTDGDLVFTDDDSDTDNGEECSIEFEDGVWVVRSYMAMLTVTGRDAGNNVVGACQINFCDLPEGPDDLRLEGTGQLVWTAPASEDLNYFTVYGSNAALLDNTSTALARTRAPRFDVTQLETSYAFYYVTCTNNYRRESEPAMVVNQVNSTDSPVVVGEARTADRLYPSQPNPFDHTTTIAFDLANSGPVRLDVFDVAGRRVRSLVNGEIRASGSGHTVVWDGRDEHGNSLSAGIYFYRIQAGSFVETRKMVLLN